MKFKLFYSCLILLFYATTATCRVIHISQERQCRRHDIQHNRAIAELNKQIANSEKKYKVQNAKIIEKYGTTKANNRLRWKKKVADILKQFKNIIARIVKEHRSGSKRKGSSCNKRNGSCGHGEAKSKAHVLRNSQHRQNSADYEKMKDDNKSNYKLVLAEHDNNYENLEKQIYAIKRKLKNQCKARRDGVAPTRSQNNKLKPITYKLGICVIHEKSWKSNKINIDIKKLNDIYKPAGISFKIIWIGNQTVEFDKNNNKQLDIKKTFDINKKGLIPVKYWLSKEQRKIIKSFKYLNLENLDYMIFLVKRYAYLDPTKTIGKYEATRGTMMWSQKYGFLYTSRNEKHCWAYILAHELGHAFGLHHTNEKDNLMIGDLGKNQIQLNEVQIELIRNKDNVRHRKLEDGSVENYMKK